MKRWFVSLAAVTVVGLSLVYAEDAAKKPAATTQPAAKASSSKVEGIYAKLDGLTDDQKARIVAIQDDTQAQVKKLHADEATKVEALLTPEQKAQLAKLEADVKEKHREQGKEYREKHKADKATDDKAKG